MMDVAHLKSWIGREEIAVDRASPGPLRNLAAILDHERWPWADGVVPPLGHWLYFQPSVRQSAIGKDGHPLRGDFLPPVSLSRRMWAGSRVAFFTPIPIDAELERTSRIESVDHKAGATGDLLFVTIGHRVRCGGALVVEETQTLVYRGETAGAAQPEAATAPSEAAVSRAYCADSVALFRFSAVTFNGHRIHYDRDYARVVEGYPDLVVHGPFQVMLLMDLFLGEHSAFAVREFSFRARRPIFAGDRFTLNCSAGDREFDLWTAGEDGKLAMTASIRGEGQ